MIRTGPCHSYDHPYYQQNRFGNTSKIDVYARRVCPVSIRHRWTEWDSQPASQSSQEGVHYFNGKCLKVIDKHCQQPYDTVYDQTPPKTTTTIADECVATTLAHIGGYITVVDGWQRRLLLNDTLGSITQCVQIRKGGRVQCLSLP